MKSIKFLSVILSLLAVIVLLVPVTRALLGPARVMTDGCRCGRVREYVTYPMLYPVVSPVPGLNSALPGKFRDIVKPYVRQLKFRMDVKREGRPRHEHQYWDANWIKDF